MEESFLIFLVFEIIIAILAVIENSFLLFVNVKNKFFNMRVCYLIASQSIADLLTGLIAIPCEIIVVIFFDIFNCCKFYFYLL
jgi:hypothetical protein